MASSRSLIGNTVKYLTLCFALVLASGMPSAWANITSVTTTPTTIAVSPDGGIVSVTWNAVRTNTAMVTISSSALTIELGGTTIQTTSTTLSQVVTLPGTYTFVETVVIPAVIARRIVRSGASATINRTFTDGAGASTGSTSIAVSGSGTTLNINRLDLGFDTGGRVKIAGRGEALSAIADMRYSGNGTLEAEWRISTLDGVRGSGETRILRLVRRPLVSSGSGRVRLISPPLPTGIAGLYEVTLSITGVTLAFTEPTIRFYVVPDAIGRGAKIGLMSPQAGARLTDRTLFSWQPVANAAAYQLEIYPEKHGRSKARATTPLLLDDGEAPIAGRLIPASQSQTSLSNLSLRLVDGVGPWRWRIRALGANGDVLGLSDFRPITR